MQKIIKFINNLIQSSGKKILVVNADNQRLQAVKSDLGFWYCGNIFDSADIAYGIARNGVAEKTETDFIVKTLNKLPCNFTFFDIGANTGYYSIVTGHLFKSSKIYSFEPLDQNVKVFQESLRLNSITNVNLVSKAVGENEEKDVKIYAAGSGTSLLHDFTQHEDGSNFTDIIKLDTFVSNLPISTNENNVSTIDFIKIDIEGYEYMALKGSIQVIKTYEPIMFIEICQNKDGKTGMYTNPNYNDTFSLLESLGYKSYIVNENLQISKFNYKDGMTHGVHMILFIKEKHSAYFEFHD